ncbi:HlyD family secretion protein [Pseudorhodobacter sp.]|uniref:HlyD family secretion protein n=1 Tax=Pseudorhodobacter sp. TaxID=1934400 RepID=UPI002648B1D9|nr:HlyD family secretion protein [Pseudorhodobacter sp.]MDN5786175.1 HlyD family secretion protein [Pseudorhodobacter sp.]
MTDDNEADPSPDAEILHNIEPEPDAAPRNPAKRVALGVVVLLLALTLLYALSDRMAPSSSRGIVSAHVAQIAPRVSGEVTEVMVEDDAVVQAGDALFTLDARPFELAQRQAEASLATATQGVNASSASLVAAQAAVTQARSSLDTVRSDADRTARLEERGIVAKAQGEAARAKVSDAEARLQSAEANLAAARAQLGPDGAENPAILAAEAQLERAQYDLASTTIRAPHYGVVTNVTLSAGQFIGAGNPALTFIDADAAWVTIDLRENQLQDVAAGDPVHLLFDAVPGQIFDGRVQSIAWGINPGRSVQGGLIVNQPSNRWFEPARRIPVRVELTGGMEAWPRQVRVGGKVHAVVFADGTGNPIALVARGLQRLRSWTSFLH